MGLGVSALIAQRTSNGGTGPLAYTVLGTATINTNLTATLGTRLGASQYFVSVNSGTQGSSFTGLFLPGVGGDNGALLADDYVINNATGNNMVVMGSNGVLISATGSNTSYTNMASHTSMTIYPVSSTQWIGVKGN
jgi:hypothetical protein